MGRSQALYRIAKERIPGGTQLLTKRPEMFLPELWPAYYKKANGCEIWDLDGKRYLDMSFMGIGSCILGYAYKDVDNAVVRTVRKGAMATLNCPEEVELAGLLCKIHPWAEMVRFGRTGGEAMAMAVRLARARTGKDLILFCGYHGWHDWYLAANLADDSSLDGHLLPGLEPRGVPRALKGTAIPFEYNDIEAFLRLEKKYRSNIAAVVMEPIRNFYPKNGFLQTIRKLTGRSNIPLVFDEITSGWRLSLGGAHMTFKVYPDMCVFGKAMSNGYPMAAVIGRKKIMNMAQKTFISSTYWTERIGPTASLETIKALKLHKVAGHLNTIGKEVQDGWERLARRHGIKISISGIYPLSHFSFIHKDNLVMKTLYTQYMLEKNILATTSFYASYAHKIEHVERYLEVTDEAFSFVGNAIRSKDAASFLRGPVCHGGFKRLT